MFFSLLDDYHMLGVLSRCWYSSFLYACKLSKRFQYVSCAFNVSMCIWSLPDVIPFLISLSFAFTSHCVISGSQARAHTRAHAHTNARTHERTYDVKRFQRW